MAYKAPKPTKAQLAEAKVRAAASGIAMNQSAKGLRNASKAIVAGASMLPAGRAVKVATTAAKAIKAEATMAKAGSNAAAKANSRADAKRGVYAKENMPKKFIKKTESTKAEAKANARGLKAANKPTKAAKSGEGNNKLISVEVRRGVLKNTPPARANRTRGGGMATLKRQEAAAKADKLVSNLKNTKPMENVPKGTSDRFNATLKRLATEEAKKKKK